MFFACFSCGVWYEAQQRYASTDIFHFLFPISDFRFTRRHYTWVHPRVNHIRFYNAINYLLLFDAKVKRLVLAMWINEDKRG